MARESTAFSLLVLLIGGVVVITTLYPGLLSSLSIAPPQKQLKLDVAPTAIPITGTWSVTSYLTTQENTTRVSVNSTVTMTATLTDGNKDIMTRESSNGVAFFPVPSDTVGVRFDASYKNYTGSTYFSGPTVISESLAEAYAGGGILFGIGYVGKMAERVTELKASKTKLLILGVLFSGITFFFPLYYLFFVFPPWYGKGWAPSSVLGIPNYLIAVVPAVLAVASFVATYKWPPSPNAARRGKHK